jgi:hypothetical protein
MKKLIIALTFICLMNNIQAQEEPKKNIKNMSNIELNKYYKKKGKNQIAGGFTLLGAGIVINAISITSVTNNLYAAEEAGVGLIIGTASMLGSIPLFIIGSKNKNRARILIQDSNIPVSLESNRNIPLKSVGIKFPIGK